MDQRVNDLLDISCGDRVHVPIVPIHGFRVSRVSGRGPLVIVLEGAVLLFRILQERLNVQLLLHQSLLLGVMIQMADLQKLLVQRELLGT